MTCNFLWIHFRPQKRKLSYQNTTEKPLELGLEHTMTSYVCFQKWSTSGVELDLSKRNVEKHESYVVGNPKYLASVF